MIRRLLRNWGNRKKRKTLRQLPMWMQSANGNMPPHIEDILDRIIAGK
jgi:hypothetical protein